MVDIVKLYAYFMYFIKKDLISYDEDTIKSTFLNGMNIASITSEYCDNPEEELTAVYVKDADLDMEDIIKRFNELNAQLKDKMYKEKAESVFKNIPMKMEIFYDRFDKECMDIPIFKYTDPYQIFQRLSCASNEDVVIIKEKLMTRINKNPDLLLEEKSKMNKLKQIINDYITDKPITIKTVVLSDFAKAIEKALESVNEEKSDM